MAKAKGYRALGQGHLDSLCGIYSVVNAIRWLARDQQRRPSAAELFAMIIREVDPVVDVAEVLIDGILPNKLWAVLRTVLRKLRDEHGLAIVASRPFYRRPSLALADVTTAIASDCEAGDTAYVTVFWGELNHWSVIYQMTDTAFMLRDSIGIRDIHINQCQMPNDNDDARPHIFELAGIIRLSMPKA